ncbi:hypothetical protein, partial [Ruminococcus sp.]
LDENDKVVLIDKNGKVFDVNLEIPEYNLGDGRVVAQYNDKTYIKNREIVTDTDGNIITDAALRGELFPCGFVNGYCITKDNNGVYNLIDNKGKNFYTNSADNYEISRFYSVDQNGLFEVVYNLKNNDEKVKTEILDLSGNVAYTIEDKYISPIGKGMFKQLKNESYKVYKVIAE